MPNSLSYAAVATGAGLTGVALAMWKSPEIYDSIIVKMTARWYKTVLEQLPEGSRVCDVGIGTGSALFKNTALLKQKGIHVVGVDYDSAYIVKAGQQIVAHGAEENVSVQCMSVYDDKLLRDFGTFDTVYFSGSFTLLPDPLKALQVASALTTPEGRIYITQTYQRQYLPCLSIIKPLLRYLITIDFGPLTYEADIAKILEDSKMEVLTNEIIPDSVDNRYQVAKLIVLKPKKE